jgi:hypothetical protein
MNFEGENKFNLHKIGHTNLTKKGVNLNTA